jgi:NAD(P)-dependent dehydrogenase (short-subunit alcohol dehydrogenase family)
MKLPKIDDLTNKTIVLTGGAGVLGQTMAEALCMAHANVAILDLNEDAATTLASKLQKQGYHAIGIGCNVLQKESLEQAKQVVLDTYGSIDVLINGAGGNHPKGTTDKEYFHKEDLQQDIKTFFDLDSDGVQFVFHLNFIGTLLATQVFAKEMLNGGSIINISSMSAFAPLTKIPAYSGAKAAVSNFTKWLATYFSKVGIRCNAIAPGFFLTKQNESLLLDEQGQYTERANKIINGTPMGRFGHSDELIGALLFLINEDASSFINGVVLPVDGGYDAYSGV